MQNGQLAFDTYDLDTDSWIPGFILTPGPEQSARIPAGATTNYITLTDQLFSVTQDGNTTLLMTLGNPGQLHINNKTITGLVSGTAPDSAVTLE